MRIVALFTGGFEGASGSFRLRLSRGDMALALGCAALAFIVYFLTLAPTVTCEDSGELASAAWTLGIPHPPGYPLYIMLGKAFMTVFPFGEKAFRLNLFSALLGAAASGLLTLLCLRLAASRPASLSAGLMAAFSPVLWSQATITEVYTLSALILVGLLHLCRSSTLAERGLDKNCRF